MCIFGWINFEDGGGAVNNCHEIKQYHSVADIFSLLSLFLKNKSRLMSYLNEKVAAPV
jgi:hypothetical protein